MVKHSELENTELDTAVINKQIKQYTGTEVVPGNFGPRPEKRRQYIERNDRDYDPLVCMFQCILS